MALKINNVTKVYQMGNEKVEALRGISLSLTDNEYLAIMGPSGSGKSTLMNIIGCLDTPTSGSYFLEGQDVSQLNGDQLAEIRNQKIGFVFQTFNLLPRADIFHNVELPMIYSGYAVSKRRKMAEDAIEKVGLTDRLNHKPSEPRALVNHPSIILADEPTGNLDSNTGKEIMEILDKLHAAGNTIILVTHENDIALHAHRIVKLKDGLIESDSVAKDDVAA
jgi:putative ABC transport system ATP-binding protein